MTGSVGVGGAWVIGGAAEGPDLARTTTPSLGSVATDGGGAGSSG
jgi:hypothetical protein